VTRSSPFLCSSPIFFSHVLLSYSSPIFFSHILIPYSYPIFLPHILIPYSYPLFLSHILIPYSYPQDASTWKKTAHHPLPFDEHYAAKPAVNAMLVAFGAPTIPTPPPTPGPAPTPPPAHTYEVSGL
jgi:hypothetical protein